MSARIVTGLIVSVFLLLAPLAAYAGKKPSVEKLDNISDEALQMVRIHRYAEAKKLLDQFEGEFLSEAGGRFVFSMDELRILTNAYDEAIEAAASPKMEHKERIDKVTKFRLVIDAMLSNHQPLWTELEEPIMTVFNGMKQAAEKGDQEDFQANLDSFLSLYHMIYPSLKIDIPPERIHQLNARVNYIDHYRPDLLSEGSSQDQLAALEADLKNIFDGMTEDETDPSLWWVIISTGSIIILTLSYVGWRKYQAEREKRKNRLKGRKN
ncbi:sporulation protein [Mesobacillus campisalis]|uniref:Sporulation protein n=1 Tax=Mesobacillus campisalis TaxID=1408103 RepID=A0A0M2SSP9_9BACI|nr:sporulation protein YpjB [Mesobacillus campisalis]KKK37609.1 sporulation protein [Mesobacillus campisalis]